MKRSTKRIVGWGTGVTLGVVFVLLTFVLIVAMNGGEGVSTGGTDQMVTIKKPDGVVSESIENGVVVTLPVISEQAPEHEH